MTTSRREFLIRSGAAITPRNVDGGPVRDEARRIFPGDWARACIVPMYY
jgi:hypothetical protein